MTARARTLRKFTMMALLTLLASGRTGAQSLQDFHLGSWEGSLEAGYRIERERLHSSDGSADTDFNRRRTREQMGVRNQGFYFIDPRLVSASLGLTLGLVQDRESINGTRDSRTGKLIGYAFDASLFSEFPYNGRFYANRSDNILTQPFGRSELAFQNRGVTVQLREDSPLRDWGMPYFSASARAEQQETREKTTSVLGQTFQRDEQQNNVSLDGHKGYQTADLDLRYRFNALNDRYFPQANFQSQTVNLNYSVDFGALLNWRSDSRLFYYTRTGVTPFSLFNAEDNLRINHDDNLSTGYHYLLARSNTQVGTSTTQNGTLDVRYQPFGNLTTNGQMSALRQELPSGTRGTYVSGLAVQYRHSLPGNGTLNLRGGGRYQLDDNRLSASQISVADEAQAAPSSLGAGAGFLLNQPFVIASSIVVVDTRGGARLPSTLGLDYEVVKEGNLTRIVPLPTSAAIQAGDALAVSYTYEVDASIKFGTATSSASIGVDYRWIAFSYGHDQSKQTLISGEDSRFLDSLRKDTAQLNLRGTWRILPSQASASYVRYEATRLAYTQWHYTGLVSYRPSYSMIFGFNTDWTVTDFTLPLHRTDALSNQLTLDWYSGPWSTTALIGRRVYKDSLQPTETISEARLKARLNYGKLDLASVFTASERIRGGFQTKNWALDFIAIRRF